MDPNIDARSRKARHNARVRARLLSAAIEIVQTSGPRAATIDAICERAGMTRGAFYTHFPSKGAIMAAAARSDPPFLTLLKGRSTATPGALWLGLRYLLDAVLRQAERDGHARPLICDLPEDAGDAQPGAAGALFQALLAELARGAPVAAGHPCFARALTLVIGAHHLARTLPPGAARADAMKNARQAVAQLLDAAEADARRKSGHASKEPFEQVLPGGPLAGIGQATPPLAPRSVML